MRYTTDDMRNWAGPMDKIDTCFGGINLAMREAADEIDKLRNALILVLNSDMAQMEEDEGRISETLTIVRAALQETAVVSSHE